MLRSGKVVSLYVWTPYSKKSQLAHILPKCGYFEINSDFFSFSNKKSLVGQISKKMLQRKTK